MTASVLRSWGQYPPHDQTPHPVYWRNDLRGEFARLVQAHDSTLPFGNGRSYGDSCMAASDHVLYLRPLDRFIRIDREKGILVAEAGVTLDEILAVAIPRGWFLPVTPGTKFITLGGAIANDVHGKSHHVRGTFGCHVRRFGLLRSERGVLVCSAEENPELFGATVGGLGLTGVIDWVELQLMPIRCSQIASIVTRFNNLAEFFALSKELDPVHEYSVAWVDCVARGASGGRGVFMVGDHAEQSRLIVEDHAKLRVPLTPPVSLVNRMSLRLFNETYYRAHPVQPKKLVVGYDPFFYPLDGILEWNRIYGPKGFQQYQCVIPEGAAEPAMCELLATIADANQGSFLAVLKRCGNIASPGLLSFPLPGVSLALDFPQKPTLPRLFERLDAIVRAARGRLYPAKDAHMCGEDFRRAYPGWERLEALRDPALCSRFWRRVTS